MSLRSTYDRALAEAELEAEQTRDGRGERRVELRNGAVFRVKVDRRLATRQVILARRAAPVGETEEITFRREFRIPGTARRSDHGRDRDLWHRVSYTWTPGAAEPEAAPIPLALDGGGDA